MSGLLVSDFDFELPDSAIALRPGYAEAHFYLAVTLEKLGRSSEARPHWREYRGLAPDGEFFTLSGSTMSSGNGPTTLEGLLVPSGGS